MAPVHDFQTVRSEVEDILVDTLDMMLGDFDDAAVTLRKLYQHGATPQQIARQIIEESGVIVPTYAD